MVENPDHKIRKLGRSIAHLPPCYVVYFFVGLLQLLLCVLFKQLVLVVLFLQFHLNTTRNISDVTYTSLEEEVVQKFHLVFLAVDFQLLFVLFEPFNYLEGDN